MSARNAELNENCSNVKKRTPGGFFAKSVRSDIQLRSGKKVYVKPHKVSLTRVSILISGEVPVENLSLMIDFGVVA